LYQDELTDVNAKIQAIHIILASLANVSCFEEDNSETLVHNTAQYAHKLPKKSEQVFGTLQAAELFWNTAVHNEGRVSHYMKKAEKIAEGLGDNDEGVFLQIETLNKYVNFMLKEVPSVDAESLNHLITHINNNVRKLGNEASQETRVYLANTNKYIRARLEEGKLKGVKLN